MTKFTTYSSENAKVGWEWIAIIYHGDNEARLDILFHDTTEEGAINKASEFWEKSRAEREANIEARRIGRIKAEETRKRKKNAA